MRNVTAMDAVRDARARIVTPSAKEKAEFALEGMPG